MSDTEDDRVYKVIEFLANVEQIGGKLAKISGPVRGNSEAQCYVGDVPQEFIFDSGDLSEQDGIAILQSGVGANRLRQAVVTVDPKASRAKSITFAD